MPAPASAPESFAVARLQTADVAALLERLDVAELVERGAVNVISLDAIKAKLGDRWERKQADIWAHVERSIAKTLAPQDISHRLTDCDYLVAVVSDNAIAAQSLCIHILEETLVFFLGACQPSDLTLQTVHSIAGGKIDCRTIDSNFIRRRAEGVNADEPSRRITTTPSLIAFLTATGRELKVSHAPDQLISLRQGFSAGVRSEPTVTDAASGAVLSHGGWGRLADHDLERIDHATFEMGLRVIKIIKSDRPGLILPITFQTLASGRSRAALFALAPADLVRQRILIEIVNIDPGTPKGRLAELVGLLRAHTTGVLARVSADKAAIEVLKDIRLAGVALDLSEERADEAALLATMAAFHNRAAAIAPSLQVLGLPNRNLFGAALKIGLTHASLRREAAVNLAA